MRRRRFPFIIGPSERRLLRVEESGDVAGKFSRILGSLSLVEAALEELLDRAGPQGAWRDFFASFVPVMDGFDGMRLAIARMGREEWTRGIEILLEKLETLLESRGFRSLARTGMAFDPSRHQAVGTRDSPGVPRGTITEIVENGWEYNGKVVRYAKVIVVKE